MHIVFAVNAIHAPCIEKNQQYEDVYRSLLGEPESKLKAADADCVKLLDQQYPENKRAQKPDRKAETHQSEVGAPICQTGTASDTKTQCNREQTTISMQELERRRLGGPTEF
jgi:hypothetical protein